MSYPSIDAVQEQDDPLLDEPVPGTGFSALVDALQELGVVCYSGVTGGGVIHLTKLLEPASGQGTPVDVPHLFTVPEYVAGFVPVGYHIASGSRAAACITTTGAATKLAGSGMSDARFHNVPAVYLVALNSKSAEDESPLQDVSRHGISILEQLRAEFGEHCIHVEDSDPERLLDHVHRVKAALDRCKPVVIAFHPDMLNRPCPPLRISSGPIRPAQSTGDGVDSRSSSVSPFPGDFIRSSEGRRVVMLVTDEAARSPDMPILTTLVSAALGAPVVWTVNGAWGTDPNNELGYGHIGFGGNDSANALWLSLGPEDVLLSLGFEPGEYVLNLRKINAGTVYHLTNLDSPYGALQGDFSHRCAGDYKRIKGDIGDLLRALLTHGGGRYAPAAVQAAPSSLNTARESIEIAPGNVDFARFLGRIHQAWRPDSLGFDDVCLAYKDRQYVTQRRNPNIRFYSAYQGSAMGGAFGMAVGAKLAVPDHAVFCFSGDGCYQMYAGALPQCAELGLRLFIIDNQSYAIVNQGLGKILPETSREKWHGTLKRVDHVAAARAYGWDGIELSPDLSNFDDVIEQCYASGPSLLVRVPVDPWQELGGNPRLGNLSEQSHL
ncbi:thiamine pyrophosphate-dependent enzyme [Streptomyces sp. NPDC056160]|uniref:thiamine pyrophosphate-dependent enzyme n=1 Tax=Streptomyces sp. NPDC056160 TaxID=3345731 RepID=UPI0035DB042C